MQEYDQKNISNGMLLIENILKSAIHDYLVCSVFSQRYFLAKEWLFKEKTIEYPKFSCEDICNYMDLNINRLRYEINCLFDKKKFIKSNRYRYICNSDFEELLENSTNDKKIIWM